MARKALEERSLFAVYPLELDAAGRRTRGGGRGVRLLDPSAARQRRIRRRRCGWRVLWLQLRLRTLSATPARIPRPRIRSCFDDKGRMIGAFVSSHLCRQDPIGFDVPERLSESFVEAGGGASAVRLRQSVPRR